MYILLDLVYLAAISQEQKEQESSYVQLWWNALLGSVQELSNNPNFEQQSAYSILSVLSRPNRAIIIRRDSYAVIYIIIRIALDNNCVVTQTNYFRKVGTDNSW